MILLTPTKLVGRQLQTQLDQKIKQVAAGSNYKFSTFVEVLNGNDGVPLSNGN